MFDPSLFYLSYQKSFHRIKSEYLNELLKDYEAKDKTTIQDDRIETLNDIIRTIKIDLRQNYFHAIETLFELIFALSKEENVNQNDLNIIINLTYSEWRKNYNRIEKISNTETELTFLDRKVATKRGEISLSQHIFYNGLFPTDFSLSESLNAIKYALKLLAIDFQKKEEYNSYKHGMRVLPMLNNFTLKNAETKEDIISFDLTDSISYISQTKATNEFVSHTMIFDSKRDYMMTQLVANLIHHIIYYRRINMRYASDKNKYENVPVRVFEINKIDECCKVNVKSQDWIHKMTARE